MLHIIRIHETGGNRLLGENSPFLVFPMFVNHMAKEIVPTVHRPSQGFLHEVFSIL